MAVAKAAEAEAKAESPTASDVTAADTVIAAKERAAKFKQVGLTAFANKLFDAAITLFDCAIKSTPTDHVLFSNRSAAHMANGAFAEALRDADTCIELKPAWWKGFARRGSACYSLHRWEEAKAAYERSITLDPVSEGVSARSMLQKVEEHIERERMAAASSSASCEAAAAAEADAMAVEAEATGTSSTKEAPVPAAGEGAAVDDSDDEVLVTVLEDDDDTDDEDDEDVVIATLAKRPTPSSASNVISPLTGADARGKKRARA